MSQNFVPSFVYQRRKDHRNSGSIWTAHPSSGTRPSDACQSSISSVAPFLVSLGERGSASELAIESASSPAVCPIECNQENTGYVNEFHNREEANSKEALRSDVDRAVYICGNNCSSSKSNLGVGSASLKTDMDDTGECSSSGALSLEKATDISERDMCISILRSQGMLENIWARSDQDVISNKYCSKACKVCEQLESTKNMLICDNCEDAYHVACCNSYSARIPVGEWLCNSCLKKKHKMQKEKSSSNSLNISSEIGRNGNATSEGELGTLEFMLSDTEPYMSNVRIGDEFQASVPDWSGPVDDEFDLTGVPIETNVSKNDYSLERNSTNFLNLNSIGNWLQCQETIEGIGEDVDGTICGKWRRAPLFEVQTDNWECFDCIRWDPAHADCAIPQELEREEIVKQLKYMEMLKPRLAAKRRKLNCSKGSDSQGLSRRH